MNQHNVPPQFVGHLTGGTYSHEVPLSSDSLQPLAARRKRASDEFDKYPIEVARGKDPHSDNLFHSCLERTSTQKGPCDPTVVVQPSSESSSWAYDQPAPSCPGTWGHTLSSVDAALFSKSIPPSSGSTPDAPPGILREESATTSSQSMTHVLVRFRRLFGVYYLPRDIRDTVAVGELVLCESAHGEGTGTVVCDVSKAVKMVRWKSPFSSSGQADDPFFPEEDCRGTNEAGSGLPPLYSENILSGPPMDSHVRRLPRILRRGVNKDKKRVYFSRRRDGEALLAAQRVLNEHNISQLVVEEAEYQVDFLMVALHVKGSPQACPWSPAELMAVASMLSGPLRSDIVELRFSGEHPEQLHLTRGVLGDSLDDYLQECLQGRKEDHCRLSLSNEQVVKASPPSASAPSRSRASSTLYSYRSLTPPLAPTAAPLYSPQPSVIFPKVGTGLSLAIPQGPSPYYIPSEQTPGANGNATPVIADPLPFQPTGIGQPSMPPLSFARQAPVPAQPVVYYMIAPLHPEYARSETFLPVAPHSHSFPSGVASGVPTYFSVPHVQQPCTPDITFSWGNGMPAYPSNYGM